MVQLVELIPDPDVVVALEPEELGLRMLPVLASFRSPGVTLQPGNFFPTIIGSDQSGGYPGQYPQNRRGEIRTALIEAWASMKSFKPKDGSGEPPAERGGRNGETDFHGAKRSNDTHASTTDPEARLYRKGQGKEAKLCFLGHVLMENRNGLVVDACLTPADGHAERIAALHMIEPRADRPNAITLGADKAYDAEDFVNELRAMNATPHVAQNTSGRRSAIDGRTTRHAGYAVSQCIRKRIEEAFGWIKTIAGQEKTKFRGRERVGWAFAFAAAAYNLMRLPKLMAAPA